MLSIDVATAASTHTPVSVISREVIHTGPIVKMKVPAGAANGTYPSGEERIPFLQFSHFIRGGRVNFFVHSKDPELRGKNVTALATVLKKTLGDGREYLYVDLTPVDDQTPVTHRLVVTNNDYSSPGEDQLVFETPNPLRGIIIFSPPGAKMAPTSVTLSTSR